MNIVPENLDTCSSDGDKGQSCMIKLLNGGRFISHFISPKEVRSYYIEEDEILTKLEDFDQHIRNAKDPKIAVLDRIIDAAIKKREQLK